MDLSLLYRGPLTSCNYSCPRCPFAKRGHPAIERARDAACLERVVAWVETQESHRVSILFTPRGEALVHRRYQRALQRLSGLPHVPRVAIQTNLSCRLDWLETCDRQRLALWTTYHPTEVSRKRYVAKCRRLVDHGVRFSVGVVGSLEHLDEIEALRRDLPSSVYLWINALRSRGPRYYSGHDVERCQAVDPLFPVNLRRHASRGRACRTGESVLSVDGDGNIRRCHFVPHVIGNLYASGWEEALQARPCPRAACDCHIGYVHLRRLRLDSVFAGGILERIPSRGLLTDAHEAAIANDPDRGPRARNDCSRARKGIMLT